MVRPLPLPKLPHLTRRTTVQARAWPAMALVALLCGCALDPKLQRWERDFYYSERLYIDGQHDLATHRFAALRAQASDPRDADEAGLMACEVQSRAANHAAAAACYDELAVSAHGRPMRVRAVVHAAELRYDHLDRQRDALTMWWALIARAPDEAATQRALDHIYLHGDRDGQHRAAVVDGMLRHEQAAPDSEIADNLLLRAAMLLERDGRREAWQRAVALLERMEQHHREDSTLVDCLMTRARLYGKLSDLRNEARDLERMVDTYETSYVFASYAYEDHKTASARLIELYRGPLQDPARAEHHARNLPDMLRRPVKMPAYLLTLAETQEQQGKSIEALQTYREILAYTQRRNADYRDNDERICVELGDAAQTAQCRKEVAALTDVETRECAIARQRIAGLEAQLHVAHQPDPTRPAAQAGAP